MTNVSTIVICLFVSFGGFLFGYDTGLISGIMEMPVFKDDFGPGDGRDLQSSTKSLLVSILSVGTFIGSLSAGHLADAAGRRWAIIISCMIFCVGCVLQTVSHSLALMLPGRIGAGLGVGLLSDLVPLYQAEAAPKHLRGALVSSYQLAITIGIVVAQGVNQGLKDHPGRASYRIPIGIQLVFAGILMAGMFVLPESPRNLLRLNRRDQAIKALCRLRGKHASDPSVTEEINDLQRAIELEGQIGEASYLDCFKSPVGRRTHIGVWIQMFQQLTGVNFIFYYGTTFFKQAGISDAYTTSTITGVVNVVSTLPALYLMERIGRRKLLLTGTTIMLIGQLIVGSVGTAFPATLDDKGNVLSSNSSAGICTIVFTCVFIYGFASSWGPGAWVVPAEIFPLRYRSKGMAIATASNWFWNWVLGFVTPYLVDRDQANLGPKIAFLWAAFILAGGIFVYFAVPETKGLSLEDVDQMFDSGVPMRKTSGYVAKTKDEEFDFAGSGKDAGDKTQVNSVKE
ncbi:hypothetical protein SpCBS45565_g05387 [Spizellomyces sp. 'palustris']|nr:hypothetical protein SpCBS45565_g05387 [Spizellomyces sp. 'palustris']